MGKLHTFEIFVTNVGGIVHPGDTLRGQVFLEASQPVDAKEIRIECRGVAHVLWMDGPVGAMQEVTSPAHIDHHTAEEEYVAVNNKLWSGLLPKGSHNLHFEFHIPEGVPSSFDGEFGYVRYWLKVFIDRSWRTDTNTRYFTVLAKVDLNRIPEASEAAEASDHMKVSALFSPSGTCHAALRLHRKGFVPGEIIPLTFIIRNDSARAIQKVWLELREITDYKAGSQDKRTERIITKHKVGTVPARTTIEKREDSLRLAACPPNHLRGCSLIHPYHEVVLKVKPSAISFKRMKIPIELIVGSIPLRQGSLTTAVGQRGRLVGLHRIPVEHTQPSTSTVWKSMPPPTYTEALSRSPSPSSSPETDRRHSLKHHDYLLHPPPVYTPPRPRASTNSSILRARGR